MRKFLAIAKALSDQNRVRILMFLRGRELCLCQIIEMLGLASSTVSRHMSVLTQAGLVRARKDGRWRYFRRAGPGASSPVRRCLRWVDDTLADDETVAADGTRLQIVAEIPVDVLCGVSK